MMDNNEMAVPDANHLLFTAWSTLRASDKHALMERLEHEHDPFRQSLLDTLLALSPDELFMAYEDGYQASNWQLMALVIQVMPDEVLKASERGGDISKELSLTFELKTQGNQGQMVTNTLIYYPYFYALEKANCSRSDCHPEAAANFQCFSNASAPKATNFHMGYYAGLMHNQKTLGADKFLVERALNTTQMIAWNSIKLYPTVDSYFYGFIQFNSRMDFVDIVFSLLDEDRVAKVMADLYTSTALQFDDNSVEMKYLNLKLMQRSGVDKITSAIQSKINVMNQYIFESLIHNYSGIFDIKDPVCKDEDFTPIITALCELQINNVSDICSKVGFDPFLFEFLDNTSFVRHLYTTTSTIEHFISSALKIRQQYNKESINMDSSESFSVSLNKLINDVQYGDEDSSNCYYELAALATLCLVLSGTQHPDLLMQLDREAGEYVLSQMDELGVEFDTRIMMKTKMMSPAEALDRELGL